MFVIFLLIPIALIVGIFILITRRRGDDERVSELEQRVEELEDERS